MKWYVVHPFRERWIPSNFFGTPRLRLVRQPKKFPGIHLSLKGFFGVFIVLVLFCFGVNAEESHTKMVRVGPGIYRPLYPPSEKEKEIPVKAFWLDRFLVTNGEFLDFVKKNPKWRRDQVFKLFADDRYLSHWNGPITLGAQIAPESPVVFVSWFAAKAYCEARDARLPREAEWELAASASETSPDGRDDPVWRQRILNWYAKPAGGELARVGLSPPNYWKVYDLHGLVWEWIYDYNAALVSEDNREQGGAEKLRFCGSGALKAADKSKYADFMRIAFRSSLEARYSVGSLGFRCARDLEETEDE